MTGIKPKGFFEWFPRKKSFWILGILLSVFINWGVDFNHLGFIVGQSIGLFFVVFVLYFYIYQFYKEGFNEGRYTD